MEKIYTLYEELELLEKYLYGIYTKQSIENTTTPFYKSEGEVFPFTNEDLKSTFNINLSNKRSLIVTSSGDHILQAVLNGATDITGFDINRFCKYYAALKIASIKTYDYKDFKKILPHYVKRSGVNNINIKLLSEVVSDISKYLTEDEKKFWDYYIVLLSHTDKIKCNFFHSPSNILYCSYDNEEVYEKLKDKLNNVNINYIDSNISDLARNTKGTFDFMHISNMLEYVTERHVFIETLVNSSELLSSDGIINACLLRFPEYYDDNDKELMIPIRKCFKIEKINPQHPDAVRFTKN